MMIREILLGDVRKQQAQSNVASSGGGARDLRLSPWANWNPFLRRMFVLPTAKRGVSSGRVHWVARGRVAASDIEWWRPTRARPNEGRLGRIPTIGSWTVDLAGYTAAQARGERWFWRLFLDSAGRLWADQVQQGDRGLDQTTKLLIEESLAEHTRGPVQGIRDLGQEGQAGDAVVSAEGVRQLEEATATDVPSAQDLASLDDLVRGKNLDTIIEQYDALSRGQPPAETRQHVTRLKRNYRLVKTLKARYGFKCQVEECRFSFRTRGGSFYCEAAHVRPLRGREAGLDAAANILILCANHHKMLDYGSMHRVSPTEVEIDGRRIRLSGPERSGLNS